MGVLGTDLRAAVPGGERFRPGRVFSVDIDAELPALDGGISSTGVPYGFGLVLVRLHGDPLGTLLIDLTEGPWPAIELAAAIEGQLASVIQDHLEGDSSRGGSCQERSGSRTVPVSVVVATYHRPDLIATCVASILGNDHPDFEVIVVDNSPEDPRTRTVIGERFGTDPRIRYLAEPLPGTSQARNAGIRAAGGEVVVFTDDDVVTDPAWLGNLTAPLVVDNDLACATGLTQPYELETEAQVWFEQYGGMGGGYQRRRIELAMPSPPTLLFPFTPGAGASNNMAIRRSVASSLGGFDVRLGPGTPTLGGEDLDLFVRLLLAGHTIAYEPRALVWHRHRRSESELRQHVYGYGAGSVAVLTKWFVRSSELRGSMWRHASRLPAAFGPRTGVGHDASRPPTRIARARLRGGLAGPTRWARSSYRSSRGRGRATQQPAAWGT